MGDFPQNQLGQSNLPQQVPQKFRKVERFSDSLPSERPRKYYAWCAPQVIYASDSVPTIKVKGINFIPCISFERDTVQRARYCPTCQQENFARNNDNYCPVCEDNGIKVKTVAKHMAPAQKFHPTYELEDRQVIAAARYICGYRDKLPRTTTVRFIERYEVISGKQVAKWVEQQTYSQDVLYLTTVPAEGEVSRQVDWERTARANDVIFTTTTEREYNEKKNKYKKESIDSQLQERIDSLQLEDAKIRDYCERFSVIDLSYLTKGQANKILSENGYFRKPKTVEQTNETKFIEDEPEELKSVHMEILPEGNHTFVETDVELSEQEPQKAQKAPSIPYSMMNYNDLKKRCKDKGLNAGGTKTELIQRLLEADKNE